MFEQVLLQNLKFIDASVTEIRHVILACILFYLSQFGELKVWWAPTASKSKASHCECPDPLPLLCLFTSLSSTYCWTHYANTHTMLYFLFWFFRSIFNLCSIQYLPGHTMKVNIVLSAIFTILTIHRNCGNWEIICKHFEIFK